MAGGAEVPPSRPRGKLPRWAWITIIVVGCVIVLGIIGGILNALGVDVSSTTTDSPTPAETVTASATPTPTASAPAYTVEKTSKGLTATDAQVACDTYGKRQYPYGYNPSWVFSQPDERIIADRWYMRYTAKVKNEYNAKKTVTIQCTVDGTPEAPKVAAFIVHDGT